MTYRSWRKPRRVHAKKSYQDPITGDRVGAAERVSLSVQGIMRRWRFIFAYTALCVVWWMHPSWFGDDANYTHWQLWASYMALLIESVVGIGMFSWARRDSVILRKVHVLERKAEQQDENSHVLLHDIYRLTILELEQIKMLRRIEENGNGHPDGDVVPGPAGSGVSGHGDSDSTELLLQPHDPHRGEDPQGPDASW